MELLSGRADQTAGLESPFFFLNTHECGKHRLVQRLGCMEALHRSCAYKVTHPAHEDGHAVGGEGNQIIGRNILYFMREFRNLSAARTA